MSQVFLSEIPRHLAPFFQKHGHYNPSRAGLWKRVKQEIHLYDAAGFLHICPAKNLVKVTLRKYIGLMLERANFTHASRKPAIW